MATQASDTANNTASNRARGASPDELAVIAQRAQAFTNASGVAIALSEGSADEIICRARSGASAPDIGATLRVEGTFTGLCIQSGKELRCDDCETDTRVDTAAIRALNIRSMVVTPIKEDNRVIGVLAVFAPTPHAFTITHVAVLKTMADQISALLHRQRHVHEDGQHVEAARPPAPIAKPVAVPPAPVTPPAVVIKPAAAAAAPAPVRANAPATAKAEPIKASTPLEVVPLAVPPKKEEKRVEISQRANFGTFDSVAAEEKKPVNRLMIVGVVAVLLIAAAATFAFLKMQKSGSAQAQHAQEAANLPPAAPPNSQPAAATNGAANPATPNVNVSAGSAKPVSESDTSKKSAAKSNDKGSNASADKPSPAERPVTVATLASNGPSKIAQSSAAQTPDVAPSFTVESGNAPNLSSLARPVASSTPSAAMEQSQLEPLQLIKTATLNYPPIAKARHINGAVVVEVKVGKDGKVSNPKFISGPPIFKDAAFEAVVQYQFKPAKLNGQPIEQIT
ncbi:MAG TPA: TonB family protein, partial [Candidatus Angelobacter sp.]|nr:TonB family protein [Candidatus Angelobacter sp.]